MQKRILRAGFRLCFKLIFIIGAWWFFIRGIWGHAITTETFDHMFRCFTILCCLSCISYAAGKGFNKTGKLSLKHLLVQVLACVIGVAAGYFLYAYVVKPLLVFLGKLVGGLIVICVGLYVVLRPALAASSRAAKLASMGTDALKDRIRRGEVILDASQDRVKSELKYQAGIDYEEEHSHYEDEKRRHGWE